MGKEPILHFKASRPFIVWLLILLVTFISAMLVLLTSGTDYAPTPGKPFITSLLLFAISAALFWGLRRGDKKLLLWTGALEFLILLLPLLSFNAWPDYLPYGLPTMLIMAFPILWLMLPIGFFYLQEKQGERAKLWKSLFLLAVVVGILWVAFGSFLGTYYIWDIDTGSEVMHYYFDWPILIFMWALVFLLPLAIWAYVEKEMAAGRDKKGSRGVVGRNLPEVLLLAVIIIIVAMGYMMNQSYGYDIICGDSVCDWEEIEWCIEDCGAICGDGYCTYDEDYYGSCSADCDRVVRVLLDREPECEIAVDLYSAEDYYEGGRLGVAREFSFGGIGEDRVYVQISGEGGYVQKSPLTYLPPGEESVIEVTLADDVCIGPRSL